MFFLGEFKPTILLYKITIYRPIENTFNYDSKAKKTTCTRNRSSLWLAVVCKKERKANFYFLKLKTGVPTFSRFRVVKQVSECICQKVIERPFKTQIRFYCGLLQVATYSVDCQSNRLLEDLGTTLKIKI